MGEIQDRIKHLAQIIKDQRPHAMNDTYQAVDDAWRSSRDIHARVAHCTAASTRRFLCDLGHMGLVEKRIAECGAALWRRRQIQE